VNVQGSTITMEFYNDTLSIRAGFRKYQYAEKIIFTDCRIVSEALQSQQVEALHSADCRNRVLFRVQVPRKAV
jgi:hypothetical protein